ncbi:AgmX/PglI C-terminal domain-containing protein [Myxococcus sp. SDU36]|uniref:AgmX/PglI C-terminal domain-containing protein n=1 Tax=Myxococcus sp. SDU36 TaxID=2831967 RepID=UPI002543F3E2|nr:AgmX/PglI C-terminal domain-containing protein [Myxococcus sp. SDU36]
MSSKDNAPRFEGNSESETTPDNPPGLARVEEHPSGLSISSEVSMDAAGRLPPEVIQRIIRQNYGRFRLCYENGLRNNPDLQGSVSVRFVIGRDGAVNQAEDAGSDMPDHGVVSCTVRAFYGLSFPEPEGGPMTVVYPFMFSPGG